MKQYCDKCGEVEPVYFYHDTVWGSDEELTVQVCESCADDIVQMQAGKDHQVYMRRMDRRENCPLFT